MRRVVTEYFNGWDLSFEWLCLLQWCTIRHSGLRMPKSASRVFTIPFRRITFGHPELMYVRLFIGTRHWSYFLSTCRCIWLKITCWVIIDECYSIELSLTTERGWCSFHLWNSLQLTKTREDPKTRTAHRRSSYSKAQTMCCLSVPGRSALNQLTTFQLGLGPRWSYHPSRVSVFI